MASSKKAIEIISDLIANNYPNIFSSELFDAFLEREHLGSTFVGDGLAIPHCRQLHCTQPVGVLMQLAKPIAFDLDESSKTDLIFALVVPLQSQQADANAITSITRAFQNAKACKGMRQAKTKQELYAAALAMDE